MITLLLAISILLSMLVGCNVTEKALEQNTPQAEEKIDDNNNSPDKNEIGEIVNDEGEKFIVDTTTTGEINGNGEPINSKTIIIDNIEYSLPFNTSELLDNGWTLSGAFNDEFTPNASTTLLDSYLINQNNERIYIDCIYNSYDTSKPFEDCIVLDLHIEEYMGCKYILPGGISNASTAGDVLSVYGNPYTTNYFEEGYNFDDNLCYYEQHDTKIDYQFIFNEDGTINKVLAKYQGKV